MAKPFHDLKDIDQLILIANETSDKWNEKEIKHAKKELRKRGINKTFQKNYLYKWSEIDKRIGVDICKIKEQNAFENYSTAQLAGIFFFGPLKFIFTLLFLSDISDVYSLIDLKNENYLTKYRQRLSMLLAGALFYAFVTYLLFKLLL